MHFNTLQSVQDKQKTKSTILQTAENWIILFVHQ